MALNKTNPELPSLQPLHREAPQTSPPSPAAGVLRARCLRGARGCARPLTPGGRQYNFDTNWMRLWNYNPEIEDPDHLIRSFLPITIGSTYRVQPGDTLSRVAARLRTTVKKVMEVNPDMTSDELEAGQEVCIMPCTENPYKVRHRPSARPCPELTRWGLLGHRERAHVHTGVVLTWRARVSAG
jgi:hypothetical protein